MCRGFTTQFASDEVLFRLGRVAGHHSVLISRKERPQNKNKAHQLGRRGQVGKGGGENLQQVHLNHKNANTKPNRAPESDRNIGGGRWEIRHLSKPIVRRG